MSLARPQPHDLGGSPILGSHTDPQPRSLADAAADDRHRDRGQRRDSGIRPRSGDAGSAHSGCRSHGVRFRPGCAGWVQPRVVRCVSLARHRSRRLRVAGRGARLAKQRHAGWAIVGVVGRFDHARARLALSTVTCRRVRHQPSPSGRANSAARRIFRID